MATAGSQQLTTADTIVFNANVDGGTCTIFWVYNEDPSDNVLVNVKNMHKTDEWITVPPGKELVFQHVPQGIGKVTAKAEANTPTIKFGVLAKGIPN